MVQHTGAEAVSDSRPSRGAPRAGFVRGHAWERRQRIVLVCASCGARNYRKTKARREGAPPLQLSKFCSICNAHTLHREAV